MERRLKWMSGDTGWCRRSVPTTTRTPPWRVAPIFASYSPKCEVGRSPQWLPHGQNSWGAWVIYGKLKRAGSCVAFTPS